MPTEGTFTPPTTPKREDWLTSMLTAVGAKQEPEETITSAHEAKIILKIQALDKTKKNAQNIIDIIDSTLPSKSLIESTLESLSPTKTILTNIDKLRNVCDFLRMGKTSLLLNGVRISELNYDIDRTLLNAAIDKLKEDFLHTLTSLQEEVLNEIKEVLLANLLLNLQVKQISSPKNRFDRTEISTWKYIAEEILKNNLKTISNIAINTIKTFGLKKTFELGTGDIIESLPSILTKELIDELNTDVTFDAIEPTPNQKLTMEVFLSPELRNILHLMISENIEDRPQELITIFGEEGPKKELVNKTVDLISTNSFIRHSLMENTAKQELANFTANSIALSIKDNYLKLFGGKKNVSTIVSELLINLTPSLADENKEHTKNMLQFIVGNNNSIHLFCKSVLAICHNVKNVRSSKDLAKAIATSTVSYLAGKYDTKKILSPSLVNLLFTEIIPHTGDKEINLITRGIIDALFKEEQINYWDLINNIVELIIIHPSLADKLLDENENVPDNIKVIMKEYMTQESIDKINEITIMLFQMIAKVKKHKNIKDSNALVSFLKPLFISNDEQTEKLTISLIDYYGKRHAIPYITLLTKEEIKEIRANIYHTTIYLTSEDLKNILFDGTKDTEFTLNEKRLEIIKKLAPPSLASEIISRIEPAYSGFISATDLAELYTMLKTFKNSQNILSKIKSKFIKLKLKSLIPALTMGILTYTMLYVFTQYSLTFLIASGISMSIATCPLFLFVSPIYKNTKIKDIAKLNGISISLALIAIFSIIAITASNSFAFNPLPYITICCIAICCLLLNKTHTNNLIKLKKIEKQFLRSYELKPSQTLDKNISTAYTSNNTNTEEPKHDARQ